MILSNSINFEIIPKNLVLEPFKETIFKIKFMPTHFIHLENSDLMIITKEIGDFKYFLQG